MSDKQQLAAMGAEMAEQQQPLCIAKRIEELEAQVRVMAELLREGLDAGDCDNYYGSDLIRRISAALAGNLPDHFADVSKMVAPEGWQLVPVEPTMAMISAATAATTGFGTRAQWDAMLAAAPKPEAK